MQRRRSHESKSPIIVRVSFSVLGRAHFGRICGSLFVFPFLSSAELISGVFAEAPILLDPSTLHFFALTRGSGDENSPTRSVLKPWALAILAFYAIPLSCQWFVASFLLFPLGVHHPRWRFAPLTAISNSKHKLENELLKIILTNAATAKDVPYSSLSNIQIYTPLIFLLAYTITG